MGLRGVVFRSPMGDGETLLGDFIPDKETLQPDSQVGLKEMSREVARALGALSPREAAVIRLRFGIGQGEAMTLEEVGQILGVTRERIRQIEAKVLQKMRDHPRSLTIREHGGAPKRIGFSPVHSFAQGKLCPECRKGTLVDLVKDGHSIRKCDHCAYEINEVDSFE